MPFRFQSVTGKGQVLDDSHREQKKKARETNKVFHRPERNAEREGFEPSVQFPGHSISSAAQSAALPPLRVNLRIK